MAAPAAFVAVVPFMAVLPEIPRQIYPFYPFMWAANGSGKSVSGSENAVLEPGQILGQMMGGSR